MFFNGNKFHYLPLNKSNIYINPSMDIIPQSTDVLDLGIMSKDCSFDSHISSLSRKCFKLRLDYYLSSIPDLPCSPGYNNSLDGGDCLQRWTPRNDLVAG